MGSLRVRCEFAGSGHRIKTFDFDFVSSTCTDLQARISQYDSTALLCNMRLFVNHNGPELTMHAGAFGQVFAHTYQASQNAWKSLQNLQLQQSRLTSKNDLGDLGKKTSRDNEVVIAVAAYDDQHVLLKHLQNKHVQVLAHRVASTCLSSCSSDADAAAEQHQKSSLTNNAYIDYEWASATTVFNCKLTSNGVVLSIKQQLPQQQLQMQRKKVTFAYSSLLHMPCVMRRLATIHGVVWRDIPHALKDNLDLMTAAPALAHLASERLRDSQEFAWMAFRISEKFCRSRADTLPCLYALLSSKLQACSDVAAFAVCSEGAKAINHISRDLLDDTDFFEQVLSMWITTPANIRMLLSRASCRVRAMPAIVQIAQKHGINSINNINSTTDVVWRW